MALEVAIEGKTGATATYWRVIEVNLNWYANVGSVALAGYVSSVTRHAGKHPLDARQFPIKGSDFQKFTPTVLDQQGNNPVAAAYDYVKTYKPEKNEPENPFKDAKDV